MSTLLKRECGFEVGMARAGFTNLASQTCATHTAAVRYFGEQHSVNL